MNQQLKFFKAVCELFSYKEERALFTKAVPLRWHLFKQLQTNQGVEKLPPTSGAWEEFIRMAHIQCNIYGQDIVLHQSTPNITKLGWTLQKDELVPLLTKIPLHQNR